MDRRSFLGLFAKTSVAGAAAATGLIALPETHKPIELLEPKKIITSSDEITVITHIISYRFIHSENILFQQSVGDGNIYPSPGRIEGIVEVDAYLEDYDSVLITSNGTRESKLAMDLNIIRKVVFDVPELRHKLFILAEYEINANPGDAICVKIKAHQINSNGVLV